jgi:hypothetical protein
MNRHAALLPLAVSIAFACAHAGASTPSPALMGAKALEPLPQTQLFKDTPAPSSAAAPANPRHLFTVNDEKGLLLSCVAPEIDTNPDTDLFKSCALAPGRTLDDVMHTFVQGIHTEQSEHKKELEEVQKDIDEKTVQQPTQK